MSLHAFNGAYNSLKRVSCENVETPEWETTEITMESQNVGAGRDLGSPHNPLEFFLHPTHTVDRCLTADVLSRLGDRMFVPSPVPGALSRQPTFVK